MSNILLENYLASQFKFGFELEAFKKDGWIDFTPTPSSWEDDQMPDYVDNNEEEDNNERHWDDDQPEEYREYDLNEAKNIVKKDIEDAFKLKDIEIKSDGSLEPDHNDDFAFEWATPTLAFTPTNLYKCIKGLDNLMRYGDYYTNDTCGFHVHLSFPDISDKDCIWIISKLSVDRDMLELLANGVASCEFYNDEYADIYFLEDLGTMIREGDIGTNLKDIFTTEKYRALHIHPQGTIEWRGPRNFMNQYVDGKPVYEFFKLLHKFVTWISKTLTDDEIVGFSKDQYFKLIYGENFKEGDLIKDFKWKIKADKAEKKLRNMIKDAMQKGNADKLVDILNSAKNSSAIYKVIDDITRSVTDKSQVQLIHNIIIGSLDRDAQTFISTMDKLCSGTSLLSNMGKFLDAEESARLLKKFVECADMKYDYRFKLIILHGIDSKVIQDAVKILLAEEPTDRLASAFSDVFSTLKPIAMFGQYIPAANYVNDYDLFSVMLDTFKEAANAITINNENKILMYKNDLPLVYIRRICLNAHKNPVLASIINKTLDTFTYTLTIGNEINNSYKDNLLDICKHFKNIVLTGKDE